MNVSKDAMLVYRKGLDVFARNISQAGNKNYSRQEVTLATAGSIQIGGFHYGQGVEIASIQRIRNEMLDKQVRSVNADHSGNTLKAQWLDRLLNIHNNSEGVGLNHHLAMFWNSWTTLSSSTASNETACRQEVINSAKALVHSVRTLDAELDAHGDVANSDLSTKVERFNHVTKEISHLNELILSAEVGAESKANDLRDRRDGLLDELSNLMEISTKEDSSGNFTVFVGNHAVVMGPNSEKLVERDPSSSSPYSHFKLAWEFGDSFTPPFTGEIPALLDVRDTMIAEQHENLNTFTKDFIDAVNTIYSNGIGAEGETVMRSRLGVSALGVSDSMTPLNLVPNGETGHIEFGFYDSQQNLVRTAGIVVHSTDTLAQIMAKLNNIKGLNASVISDPDDNYKLEFSINSAECSLGEVQFGIVNNASGSFDENGIFKADGKFDNTTGRSDQKGILQLFGFPGYNDSISFHKSTNISSVLPILASQDITNLYNDLDVVSVAAARTKKLGLSGYFTVDTFETATSTVSNAGHHAQQFRIDVVPTDCMDDIMNKINNLTTDYGVSMSFNSLTNQYELTSLTVTDAYGEILDVTGSTTPDGSTAYAVQLSFGNFYHESITATDRPPLGYNGLGDNTRLFALMQMNTLFSGRDANDIDMDDTITSVWQIHKGYSTHPGDNGMALDMFRLKDQKIAANNSTTLDQSYRDLIAKLAQEAKEAETYVVDSDVKLKGIIDKRQGISGVSLDEELAAMMQYQQYYAFNARIFEMMNEIDKMTLQLG
jgi:flagellar hook-associated protein FlgK